MSSTGISHAQLVERAAQWLRNTRHCCPVFTEIVTACNENPDAIGWHSARSILVECKTSRADFHADKKKNFRATPEFGVGSERYFLVPSGLVQWDELPANWGLLEFDGQVVRQYLKSGPHAANLQEEAYILCSALRRVQKRITPMSFKEFLRAEEGSMLEPMYMVRKSTGESLFRLNGLDSECQTPEQEPK